MSAPIDPLLDADWSSGVNPQGLPPQIPYPGVGGLKYDSNIHQATPTLDLLEHAPSAIGRSYGPERNINGFIKIPVTFVDVNPYSAGKNPLVHQSNTDALGECTNIGSGPEPDGININVSSLRLRGTRSPPQTYEPDKWKLYYRLICEGADFDAAIILRDVIFAESVTISALMASIPIYEMFIAHGGANRMWQLLLDTKGAVQGKQKYRCRLCPAGNRPEWKHARDSIRHFNKNHFGFSFPCNYW